MLAFQLITLTEEEARRTIHEVAERQTRLPKITPSPEAEPRQEEELNESISPPTLTPLKARDLDSSFNDLRSPPKLDPQLSRSEVERTEQAAVPVVPKYPSRRPHPEYIKKLVAGKFRPFKVRRSFFFLIVLYFENLS